MIGRILVLAICLTGFAFGQTGAAEAKSVRGDRDKPTVYLSYVCEDDEKVLLRLFNNTIWYLTIWSEKTYFPTKKPIILANGSKGYAIPDDEEVQIRYTIQNDELAPTPGLKVPSYTPKYQYGGGKVASMDSILVSIPAEHVKEGLKILVEFSYEWELNSSGNISREPQHFLVFRGASLSSANSEERRKLCRSS